MRVVRSAEELGNMAADCKDESQLVDLWNKYKPWRTGWMAAWLDGFRRFIQNRRMGRTLHLPYVANKEIFIRDHKECKETEAEVGKASAKEVDSVRRRGCGL
jgi:hypothetical protein